METAHRAAPALAVLDSVLCLECGGIYSKPAAGGAVAMSPGCPECGYVGWIPVSVPGVRAPHRFGAGRPPGLLARQR